MPQEALPIEQLHGQGYDLQNQSFRQRLHSPLEVIALKLGPLEDPDDVNGHEIEYSVGKTEQGGRPMNVHVELRQGYKDEGDRGIEIVSWLHSNVPHGDNLQRKEIPPEKAKLISNYADLSLRFTFTRG